MYGLQVIFFKSVEGRWRAAAMLFMPSCVVVTNPSAGSEQAQIADPNLIPTMTLTEP